jgi:uncharacterized protein involved in tolerance to divalent cations
MTRRYHADIGIPDGVEDPTIGAALTYTTHAHSEACRDRVQHCLPFCLPRYELVEVETVDGKPVKWVVRFPLNTCMDMVMAITSGYVVKTVWVNTRVDSHPTLDVHKYDRPEPVGA